MKIKIEDIIKQNEELKAWVKSAQEQRDKAIKEWDKLKKELNEERHVNYRLRQYLEAGQYAMTLMQMANRQLQVNNKTFNFMFDKESNQWIEVKEEVAFGNMRKFNE